MPPNDTGDRDYYREGSIECIDAIKAALGPEGFISFLRGQCIKYNWRLRGKGKSHEDSIKATWYQNRLTKELSDEVDTRTASGPVIAGSAYIERYSENPRTPTVERCFRCKQLVGDVHLPDCDLTQDPRHTG